MTSPALQRAQALLDVGRPAAAADHLARHLAGSPQDAYALCLLAQARLTLGDLEGTLELADRAVASAPDWEWPHRIASLALRRQGRVTDAVRAARECVRLKPYLWQTHVELALALSVPPPAHEAPAGRPTPGVLPRSVEAWNAAAEAVRLDPLEPCTHSTVGTVALAGGHLDTAERAFRAVLSLSPGDADALHDLALVGERRGRLTTAVEGFAAAAAADPYEPTAAHNVLVIGWRLSRRLLFALLGLSLLAIGLGDRDLAADGVPPATGVPVVLVTLAALAGVALFTVLRLPRPVRLVLRRAAVRGWGLTTTISGGVSALLLAAAPWPEAPEARSGLARSAVVVCFVALCAGRLMIEEEARDFERRRGS